MDAYLTSPLPAVYFYEDENTEETARQCTFFDNCKKHYIFMHCQLWNTVRHRFTALCPIIEINYYYCYSDRDLSHVCPLTYYMIEI